MISFLIGLGVVVHHLLDLSAASRGILSRQGVGRIRHLSCCLLWLQSVVKLRRDFSCDAEGHATSHVVSTVSGHLNLADLGTKRLGKKRLIELMGFCNLTYIENDKFVPCSDDADNQTIALIKALQRRSCSRNVDQILVQFIARLSVVSALSSGTMAMDADAGVCVASMEQAPSNFLVLVYCFMCMMIGIFIAHAWNAWCDNSHMGWRGIRMKVIMTFVASVPSFELDYGDYGTC